MIGFTLIIQLVAVSIMARHTTASDAVGNAAAIRKTVKIGYVSSTLYPSGEPAPWGEDMLIATKMAIHHFNSIQHREDGEFRIMLPESCLFEARGMPGRELENALGKMADKGVTAVLGGDWTRVAAQMSAENGTLWSAGRIPVISAGATSSSLDSRTTYPGLFRTCYSDSTIQSTFSKAFIPFSSNVVAVIGTTDDFGYGGLRAYNTSLKSMGVLIGGYGEFISSNPETGEAKGDDCANDVDNFGYVCDVVHSVVRAAERYRGEHSFPLFISATGPSTQCVLGCLSVLNVTSKISVIAVCFCRFLLLYLLMVAFDFQATEVVHPQNSTSNPSQQKFFELVVNSARGYFTYLASPYKETKEYSRFVTDFVDKTGHSPSVWAIYAYDAVFVAATAILKAAPRSISLVEALQDSYFFGLSGLTKYNHGSRIFLKIIGRHIKFIQFVYSGYTAPLSRRKVILRMSTSGATKTDQNGFLTFENFHECGISGADGQSQQTHLYYDSIRDLLI
eukprot:jgi/Bigna1/132278/aug1.17_g6986